MLYQLGRIAMRKMHLSTIKEPQLLEDDADVSDLPHAFQNYMVQFALIQAKKQDHKIEEIPTLVSEYEQGIQMVNMQAAQSYYGLKAR